MTQHSFTFLLLRKILNNGDNKMQFSKKKTMPIVIYHFEFHCKVMAAWKQVISYIFKWLLRYKWRFARLLFNQQDGFFAIIFAATFPLSQT